MNRLRRYLAAMALLMATVSGCQTWFPEAGLTLPTGHYLRHRPQIIPPSPEYPLSRELANNEQALAQPGMAAPRPQIQP